MDRTIDKKKIFTPNSLLKEGGHWAVYSTSPQSQKLTFSHSLAQQTQGPFIEFDWLVHLFVCPNVLTTNCNLQMGNYVYHHWECTSIY